MQKYHFIHIKYLLFYFHNCALRFRSEHLNKIIGSIIDGLQCLKQNRESHASFRSL